MTGSTRAEAAPGGDERLARECEYIHRAFFGDAPPAAVTTRYAEANRLCFPDPDPQTDRVLGAVLANRLDVEAVEFALRLRRRCPRLTRKIQILFFLVEVRSRYYSRFINERPGAWAAWRALVRSALETAFKAAKGFLTVWRYSLA